MNQNVYVEEKSDKYTSKLDICSRLFEDNIIYLFGEISDVTAYTITQQLQYLAAKDPNKDITMIINSPGGSVSAGMAIYDVMNKIPNDVATVCVGIAASMASFILSGGTKGKRSIYQNAEVLIHQPLGGASGQATDISIAAEHILKIKEKLNLYLSKNTGKSIKTIENDVERDYWMTSQEALDYGIVDKYV